MKRKKEIKTTDWLTKGMTEEQIQKKKEDAIREADIELIANDKKQIEEMAKIMCDDCAKDTTPCVIRMCDSVLQQAETLHNAGYRKQKEGKWEFEHNPINDPKKYFIRIVCSNCGLKTGQVSNFCPNCGAKMKGGE